MSKLSNSNYDGDHYSDDPIDLERPKTKKRVSGVLALVATLIGGTLYIQTTLAANISLNSGSGVEFGQGVAQTVACSGSNSITITPIAGFVNSSGAGTFKFSSIRVDDVPAGCKGSDFKFSAYDNNPGSAAQAIFNTTSTRAVVYAKSDGTFIQGTGGTGLSVTTNSSSSFTVTFTSPVALSSNVNKVTVESTAHTPFDCSAGGACVVGETGPGGGTVFYVNSAGFTETGSDCGASCQYLQYAPATWNGGVEYPRIKWSSDVTHQALATVNASNDGTGNQALGAGFSNTQAMLTSRVATGYVGDISGAAYQVSLYSATDSSAGKWFLPSSVELQTLYDSTAFSTFQNLNYAYINSSSEKDNTSAYIVCYSDCAYAGLSNRESRAFDKNDPGVVVPIRAFKKED